LNRGFEVPATAAAAFLLLPGSRPPCNSTNTHADVW
jgi:hypothetical protein